MPRATDYKERVKRQELITNADELWNVKEAGKLMKAAWKCEEHSNGTCWFVQKLTWNRKEMIAWNLKS